MILFFRIRTPNPTRYRPDPIPESTESRDPNTEQLFGMWRSSRKEAKKNPQPVEAGGFTRTIQRVILLCCSRILWRLLPV